jgi:2,3-bisphosphoglycerate-independent phosphoglycerate mutase
MTFLNFLKKDKKKVDVGKLPVIPGLKPVVLLILDGWGIAPPSQGNAIALAKTPNMDYYWNAFPHAELIASGESVGLPANEDGNSEVGHLTIGAGRVMYQSLKRINIQIEDGTFFGNSAFLSALEHTQKNGSKLHIMGLVGTGGVHSSKDHLYALLEFCKRNSVRAFLHLFTDGRDTPPQEAESVFGELESYLAVNPFGKIATIAGRYYAMDRDHRWERTQKCYDAIVEAQGNKVFSVKEALDSARAKGQTDEFIEPTVICENGVPIATVGDNDAVILFNFRIDRPRQLTMAFILPDFEKLKAVDFGYEPDQGKVEKTVIKGGTFKREKWPQNLFFVTMTEYQRNLPVSAVAFPPQIVGRSLSEIFEEHGIRHLHLAESEKERMVTYHFDGLRDTRFPNEDVVIVPSPKVPTYDKKPEMALWSIVEEFKKYIYHSSYHFIIINFANPDMVAHSGDLTATIKACEYVDQAVKQIVDTTLSLNGTVIITADHGNAEELLTFPSFNFFFTTKKGETNTDHSNNPVPGIIVNQELRGRGNLITQGSLSDIAPTILSIMKLPAEPDMTGRDLLSNYE